ncbi:imidazole glycerol phosphate synthase subunit HisH [Clostridium aminobutyricum]|uniref:Imidazole glycerol phosphate synthase subunit HisH n=1 Tax=Clostridium aminobutyricum TaxID=33953 RepID=A0A939DAJ0_CLOAM|nr:imidazole glycerol phosphate synthase subunit HisH [Clostridium aminobutyricum]MBN7774140.1 imidazole glycerol phosphate synthase subunit HisH [Clostridium aminobutyricum]
MIAIIDYGVGNLYSLSSSFQYLGIDTKITNAAEDLIAADKILLPGVGAFADAIQKLRNTGLIDTICSEAEKGKPLLGICLGMQLLFDKSYEYGEHDGLGLIKGIVAPLEEDLPERVRNGKYVKLKVPHIGWNSLALKEKEPLFKYIKNGDYVYYVHSFYAKDCHSNIIASSSYDIEITGAVRSGNVYGTQFHPEKSGTVGLNILKAFAEL